MHLTVQNLVNIKEEINSNLSNQKNHKVPKIIAVSKTFSMDKITPLIEYGHLDFGENKVQEAIEKWSDIKFGDLCPSHFCDVFQRCLRNSERMPPSFSEIRQSLVTQVSAV